MNDYLIIGGIFVVLVYASLILERLPKPKTHKDFTWELPDQWVMFRADTLHENDFKVTYIDDWEVGRSFSISGKLIEREEGDDKNPQLKMRESVNVNVTPIADWFPRSRIGWARPHEAGGASLYVVLPYQIANRILDEMRRNVNQTVSIGVKASEAKDGKTTFGIYSFELSPSYDD